MLSNKSFSLGFGALRVWLRKALRSVSENSSDFVGVPRDCSKNALNV